MNTKNYVLLSLNREIMGRGDRRSNKGKRFRGSVGNSRPRQNKINRTRKKKAKLEAISRLKSNYLGVQYLMKNALTGIRDGEREKLQKEKDASKKQELERILSVREEQLNQIESQIVRIRQDHFQFSAEEIYSMFGRYDKFIGIDFHPNSQAAQEFGESIMGVVIYNRRERQDLDTAIKSKNVPRTNRYVKIDPSELCNLSPKQVEKLKTQGFLCGDIFQIQHSHIHQYDSYRDKGEKEIPNSVPIHFDARGMNPDTWKMFLFEQRIQGHDYPLIEAEWDQYYTLKILYFESDITEEEWTERIYKRDSDEIRDNILYQVLSRKLWSNLRLSIEELGTLKKLIDKRANERSTLVEKEVFKSENKSLSHIIEKNQRTIDKLNDLAYRFENENLSTHGAVNSVYLDLERFLHIFIRHFPKFQVGDWKDTKTSFQYSFQDTLRVIRRVIQDLQPQIDEAINEGKGFWLKDKSSHYYNGTYYVVKIETDGRLIDFYPHDKV